MDKVEGRLIRSEVSLLDSKINRMLQTQSALETATIIHTLACNDYKQYLWELEYEERKTKK